jgi:hypothetical protein
MASFQLLEPREEDELHKSRLLNVEEKPFKRITKHLLAPGTILSTPSKLLTPPPEGTTEDIEAAQQKALEEVRQFRSDISFDFAAFDSSICRIQFLRNSNERERARYAADKDKILATAQEVRDSTAELRVKLEEAKKTLEQRKKFDELAEKITNNRLLRPREDQEVNLRKLEEECRELERESQAYGETWKERREQFQRIVEEGQQLRRLIRDEKEEVERREGMDGGEEDGEVGEGSRGGMTPKHSSFSGNATPRPDGPMGGSPDRGLKPRPMASGSLSRAGSRATSRAPSLAPSERRREEGEEDSQMTEAQLKVAESDVVEDIPMTEAATLGEADTLSVIAKKPDEEEMGSIEEGEAEDTMDTT